jgi:hypothetical protein
MTDSSGFYKLYQGEDSTMELSHAPNFVYAPNYTLLKENKDNYEYPVDGWSWFDSQEQAEQHYGIEPTE